MGERNINFQNIQENKLYSILQSDSFDFFNSNGTIAFFGYSDATSLHNAIRAKAGFVTFYGPSYASINYRIIRAALGLRQLVNRPLN